MWRLKLSQDALGIVQDIFRNHFGQPEKLIPDPKTRFVFLIWEPGQAINTSHVDDPETHKRLLVQELTKNKK